VDIEVEKDKLNDYLNKFSPNAYYNKKEIMYRLGATMSIDEYWPMLLEQRKHSGVTLPFKDQKGRDFWFICTDLIKSRLANIDDIAHQELLEVLREDKEFETSVIFNALVDEAFFSSTIEGAFSTKKRTQEIINRQQKPQNKSEQMISNNYRALEYILENILAPIDEHTILSIYKLVVEDTLAEEDKVEKYRNDYVYVLDETGSQLVYEAPDSAAVQNLMDELLAFINAKDDFHPIIKAIIIHFLLIYIHPFFDGNGRTARAVSYMYLLQAGYNFFRFFSISSIVNEEKPKYYKAIKDCEDYDSDLTYFIDFYTRMVIDSVARVIANIRKELSRRIIDKYLLAQKIVLNPRQKKAIDMYIRMSRNQWEVKDYQKKLKTSYETGRSDLNQLVEYNIFHKSKLGKKYIYQLVAWDDFLTTTD
jgi:Fic family protein